MTDIITATDIDRLRASSTEERCIDAAMLVNARCLAFTLTSLHVDDDADELGFALTHLLFDELEGCSFCTRVIDERFDVFIDGPESIIVDGAEVHLGSPDIAVEVGWPHRRCSWEDVQSALFRLEKIMHPNDFT